MVSYLSKKKNYYNDKHVLHKNKMQQEGLKKPLPGNS